jgi:polyisoprenoid-binding protein YceI
MKNLFSVVVLVFAIFSLHSQGLFYPIDDSHSSVKFIGQLGDWMEVEGNFQKIWGTLYFDEEDISKTSISFFIDPSSVTSHNEWRDKHLKNADFLDIEKYPELKFISRAVQEKEGNLLAIGTLHFKGKELPFTVPIELISAPQPDPWGNIRLGFKGEMRLSRQVLDFGPKEGFWQLNIQDEFVVKFVVSGSRRNMERMSMFKNPKLAEVWETALAGDLDRVEKSLRNMKETEERFSPQVIDLTAKRLHQHGLSKEALRLFKLNAELYPDKAWVISELALSHRANGDLESCKMYAQKALELDSQNALAVELLK